MNERRLARLPVQVAPRLGEETDSFIRRLARANHLKPSYLHGYLCGPPFWFGKPQLDRLADATGRSPHALERALSDASSPEAASSPTPDTPEKIRSRAAANCASSSPTTPGMAP
ncbi:hypothetical protein [Streptomyces wuyuanensis]|uniref:hypothetical protein n=1 Tax=Streptomyces wuyuanensis TaxID=1196353 RepID=UPI0034243DD9